MKQDDVTHEPKVVDQRDDIEEIADSFGRLRVLVGRRIIGRLAIESLTPELELSHLDVLHSVLRLGPYLAGETTIGAIAAYLRIDPSRASRIVAEMVDRGVLRREASQADARRIVVVPTTLGNDVLARIQVVKRAVLNDIFQDWSADDVAAFSELFERFVGGFEKAYQARDKASLTDPST